MAVEQIKIFELDIDVDSAIKSQSDLKTKLEQTKSLLDRLKKSGDTQSETYVKLSAETKNLSREYNASQTQLGKLIALEGKQITTVEQGRNALTILNKEWSKATNLYGANSKEADQLAKKHLELKNRVNELQKGVGDTSGNIGNYSKDIQEAIGKTGIFGSITSSVSNTLGLITPIYKYVRTEIKGISADYAVATASTKTFSTAQKATAITTNLVSAGLKILKVALISTGIGAIIVLLGSLVAWFSKTQTGLDFVSKALAVVGTAFDVVIDRLSSLGGALIKFISGDFSGAFNDMADAVSGVGDELAREISLVIELENEMRKLERRQIAVSVARSEINKQIKENNKIAEDVSKNANERLVAINKAIDLEKNQIAIENQLSNDKLKNQLQLGGTYEENKKKIDEIRQAFINAQGDNEAFESTLRNIGLSKTLDDDIQKVADAIIANNNQITASEEKLTTIGNKRNTILQGIENEQKANFKANQDRAKKAVDEAIKENKTLLKLYEERNKGEKDSLFENIVFAENVRDKKLAILDQELKAGKKTKTEFELESLQIKNEYLEKEKDLVIQYADEELQIFKDAHQSRIEQGQFLTDTLVEQEILRLQTIAEKEREFQAKRLEEGVINQKQYNEAIAEVDAEYKASKDEIELEQKEQKAEADVIDLENKRLLQQENLEYDLQTQLDYLERQKQSELELAESKGADLQLIQDKYAVAEIMIKENVRQAKLGIASNFLSNISNILGQESKLGKAVAIGSVIAEKASSISKIVASTGVANAKAIAESPLTFGQPWVAINTISAGASIAASVVSGARAIGEINSVKTPKAEKGITLKGNRHSNGGINLFDGSGNNVLNAEDGENMYVINRRASALINGLSSINELTGGVPLSNSTNFAMAGGMVQRSFNSNQSASPIVFKNEPIDYDLMAEKIGQANLQLPNPKTDVEDIIEAVNNRNSVVNGANI